VIEGEWKRSQRNGREVASLQSREFIERMGPVDSSMNGSSQGGRPGCMFFETFASMAREFASAASLDDILPHALCRLAALFPFSAQLSVDFDGCKYCSGPRVEINPIVVEPFTLSDNQEGRLTLTVSEIPDMGEDDLRELVRGAAGLLGALIEIHEKIVSLTQSEAKHRQLSANLAKEMWNRTEALAKETSYLEGMLRSCDDIIITTDLDARIVEFNHGAEQILGFSAEEMQGRPVDELWENAEERARILEQVTKFGAVRNYQTRLRTKSGGLREISLTLSLLKDEEGRTLGTVGVSKDVTREKEIIREIERLNQNYRETIHFINHESKNSLIVIGGFVRRLLETEQDPVRKEQLGIVYHHSKFLEAMSRDFLLMAELEHGEFKIRKELIKDFYTSVILPAMIGLKERYPDSFQSYDVSMGGVGEIELYGDRNLLEVVYRNLFGNALKYRYPDGKISYGVSVKPSEYVFNVWNEGPGVPHDQAERIFAKFYRAEDELTRQKRGTGLGLYNIRRIIEAHGGRIWCETTPGVSINFVFTLPRGELPIENATQGGSANAD
jgi:PAS domain S-box-containing protein